MKYYFTNIVLQTIYFQHLIDISMFSYFTLLNYLLLFFLIYFSSQVNIFYLPLLKHTLADFIRVAATLTFFLGYTALFLTTNHFFFFSDRQGDNLQPWVSPNRKVGAYRLMSNSTTIKMY